MTAAPRPSPTSTSIVVKPKPMPSMCGMVRRNPKFTPDASNIMLLGPGVIEVANTFHPPVWKSGVDTGATSAGPSSQAVVVATALAVSVNPLTVRDSYPVAANASESADVSIMGSGDVNVTGGAKCSVSKAGSGNVHCG